MQVLEGFHWPQNLEAALLRETYCVRVRDGGGVVLPGFPVLSNVPIHAIALLISRHKPRPTAKTHLLLLPVCKTLAEIFSFSVTVFTSLDLTEPLYFVRSKNAGCRLGSFGFFLNLLQIAWIRPFALNLL